MVQAPQEVIDAFARMWEAEGMKMPKSLARRAFSHPTRRRLLRAGAAKVSQLATTALHSLFEPPRRFAPRSRA